MTRRIREPARLGIVTAPPRPPFRGTSISEHYTDFDGATEYARIDADVFDLERTDSWSMSFWMHKTGGGSTVIAGRIQNASPFRGFNVQSFAGGAIEAQLINTWTSNEIRVRSTGFTLFAGVWKMGLVTYSGSSAASGVKIYAGQPVAGVPIFSEVTDPTPIADTLSATIRHANARMSIMARYDTVNGPGGFTSEDMCDVRFFPGRVLTFEEGRELYSRGKMLDNNDFSRSDDCAMWFRLGDGDAGASYNGNTMRDYSKSDNTATTVALTQADAFEGRSHVSATTWPARAEP